MKEVKKKVVDIPTSGSLGILAHGDIGLLAWRKVRGELNIPDEEIDTNETDEAKEQKEDE